MVVKLEVKSLNCPEVKIENSEGKPVEYKDEESAKNESEESKATGKADGDAPTLTDDLDLSGKYSADEVTEVVDVGAPAPEQNDEDSLNVSMTEDFSSALSEIKEDKIDGENEEKKDDKKVNDDKEAIEDNISLMSSQAVDEPGETIEKINGEHENGEDGVDMNEDDREMIVNLFKYFDADQSGAMSVSELGNFMRAIGNYNFVIIIVQ